MNFVIRPGALTFRDLRDFGAEERGVELGEEARQGIRRSHGLLERLVGQGRLIYGVNTGFGPLSKQAIGPDDLAELQRRLVLSNAAGVGKPLSERVVRRVMLLKAATIGRGASGVREELADALLLMLNAGIIPEIPEKGSVGASGDIAPLAHLGVAVIGEGYVFHKGERKPAGRAFQEEGIEPLRLGPKEGLALVNGTQVSTALALEALFVLEELFATALVTGALSVEAASGTVHAFDPRIQDLRGQDGQRVVGAILTELLSGSPLQADRPVKRVQDPYCLRCQPQVMGAALDQLRHAADILLKEVNGVSDNPLFDAGSGDVLYGGNFHAQPIGMAADGLALAFAEVASIAERRIALLVDAALSGLPAFLVAEPGLNSGFMVAQVTAAALVSENKSLAYPGSVDSIPTAANLEDYVSMSTYAARRLGSMAENTAAVLAIELLAAAQGLDLRRPARSSEVLETVFAGLRERVPVWADDRFFAPDIEAAAGLIASGLCHGNIDKAFLPSFG